VQRCIDERGKSIRRQYLNTFLIKREADMDAMEEKAPSFSSTVNKAKHRNDEGK